MLLYRVISAIIGIPVFLYLVWYGGIPLLTAVLVVVTLGILETKRLWNGMGVNIWLPGTLTAGLLLVIASYFSQGFTAGTVHLDGFVVLGAVVFFSLLVQTGYLIYRYPSFDFIGVAASVFTSLYVGWLLSFLFSLRQLSSGFHFVLLVLVATWSTDTFAYFIGTRFGRHKLAPVLSPKKSVEGAVGGVFGSILVSLVIGYLSPHMALYKYMISGLLTGTIGQAGDLAESAFKRLAGVKDSGNIIPGHGGILDRFDSLLLNLPVIYFFLMLSL